jgi:hypothetical protein
MAQVFIAHSSRDEWLINPVCEWLEASGVEPYLAEFETTATPLPEKFDKAIQASTAVVVIFTRNVANIQQTRDVVNWETSAAYTHKKPVYIFRESGVELPFMFNYITDYFTFDTFNVETLESALQHLYDIGLKIKKTEDTGKLVLTGLLIAFGLWQLFKKD